MNAIRMMCGKLLVLLFLISQVIHSQSKEPTYEETLKYLQESLIDIGNDVVMSYDNLNQSFKFGDSFVLRHSDDANKIKIILDVDSNRDLPCYNHSFYGYSYTFLPGDIQDIKEHPSLEVESNGRKVAALVIKFVSNSVKNEYRGSRWRPFYWDVTDRKIIEDKGYDCLLSYTNDLTFFYRSDKPGQKERLIKAFLHLRKKAKENDKGSFFDEK